MHLLTLLDDTTHGQGPWVYVVFGRSRVELEIKNIENETCCPSFTALESRVPTTVLRVGGKQESVGESGRDS